MPSHAHARISPTAHYTSHVWYRHGMSHRALTSRTGRLLHAALWPANAAYLALTHRPNLEGMLLARHVVIDHLLEQAITGRGVAQVIEIAAGFSPRGVRFMERFGATGLVYVEADLPDVAARKRRVLEDAGLTRAAHHVVAMDALRDAGSGSLADTAAQRLDPTRGLAIVTEGLLGYLDVPQTEGLWRRVARCLRGFPVGVYLADIALADDVAGSLGARAFTAVIEAFTRGPVYYQYRDAPTACAVLHASGFEGALAHRPRDFDFVAERVAGRVDAHVIRIVEAWTGGLDTTTGRRD